MLANKFVETALREGSGRAACGLFQSILLAIALLAAPVSAWAEGAANVSELAQAHGTLEAKRNELAAQIQKLKLLASDEGTDASLATSELEALHSLDLIYQSHLSALDDTAEQRRESERRKEELRGRATSQPSDGRPQSWLVLEDYRDQLEAEASRARTCAHEIKVAEGALAAAQEDQEQAARARRRHQEELLDQDQPLTTEARDSHLKRSVLASQVADATVELRRAELARLKARHEVLELGCQSLQEKVQTLGTRANFSEEDLQSRQASLAKYGDELRKRLADARQRLLYWDEAVAKQASGTAETSAQPTGEKDARPTPSLETSRLCQRLCREEIEQLERWMTELHAGSYVPRLRFRLARNEVPGDEAATWLASSEKLMTMLAEEEQLLNARATELIQNLATLYRQEHIATGTEPDAAAEQQARRAALERMLQVTQSGQLHVQMLRRTGRRLLQELRDQNPQANDAFGWGRVSEALAYAWSYELAAIGERPITVGKVVKGMIGLLCGLLLAALISRQLGKRVLPRLGFNPGAAEALRSLIFYALSAGFGMLSLELANVPLTALTFFGGAAAIAVGIASQDLVSNFMSGVILLAEQPIRVGDFVEVGGVTGTVERMGTRSTRLRTDTNVEITVPNSKLLGNNVVNLTLSDNQIWCSIKVSVDSQYPVSEVKECLQAATKLHARVVANPEPFVMLTDIGDKSLKYEVRFLISMRYLTDNQRIESELRESIDAALRVEGYIPKATPKAPATLPLHRMSA